MPIKIIKEKENLGILNKKIQEPSSQKCIENIEIIQRKIK